MRQSGQRKSVNFGEYLAEPLFEEKELNQIGHHDSLNKKDDPIPKIETEPLITKVDEYPTIKTELAIIMRESSTHKLPTITEECAANVPEESDLAVPIGITGTALTNDKLPATEITVPFKDQGENSNVRTLGGISITFGEPHPRRDHHRRSHSRRSRKRASRQQESDKDIRDPDNRHKDSRQTEDTTMKNIETKEDITNPTEEMDIRKTIIQGLLDSPTLNANLRQLELWMKSWSGSRATVHQTPPPPLIPALTYVRKEDEDNYIYDEYDHPGSDYEPDQTDPTIRIDYTTNPVDDVIRKDSFNSHKWPGLCNYLNKQWELVQEIVSQNHDCIYNAGMTHQVRA